MHYCSQIPKLTSTKDMGMNNLQNFKAITLLSNFRFVEFEDAKAAEDAILYMNGFELAGRPIKGWASIFVFEVAII